MKCTVLAIVACCGGVVSTASAQSADVFNPGFETPNTSNTARAAGWRHFNSATRRFPMDGLPVPMPAVRPGGTGVAMIELRPGVDFAGLDTELLNSVTFLWNSPAYAWTPDEAYPCGPCTCCVWYYIPDNMALLGLGVRGGAGGAGSEYGQGAGLKLEFKRPNLSTYDVYEDLTLHAGTGGQWKQVCATMTRGDWDFIFNYYNNGAMYELPPDRVSLLPLRFGAPGFGDPPGPLDDGTIFYDDVTYNQNLGGQDVDYEFWDDREVVLTAKTDAGIIEPSVPLYFNGVRLGFDCVGGDETYDLIDITDRIPSTGFFPLTFADIIANGYVRPLVQKADGTSTAIGTSVVTSPSFRPNAQALITVPTITRADANPLFNPPNAPGGLPERADPMTIQGTGNYGAMATVVSTREYPDPSVGVSQVELTYTWTATQNITLQSGPQGVGFDAFRLVWDSSMLANLASGQYDANYVEVENAAGQKRTLAIDDAPRGAYLFAAPQATAVGRSFTLYKDTAATWNPGSPSITIKTLSLTGAAGALGVQGFLASSTDPNDDSLSVWLEWVGAPATIPSGTVITGTFLITATPATALGDADHDLVVDCDDVTILNSLLGQNESSPTFNAYVDMNKDGTITVADKNLLLAITGPCGAGCPGDSNGDNIINGADLSVLLSQFGQAVPPSTGADYNGDGLVNGADLSVLLSNFGNNC